MKDDTNDLATVSSVAERLSASIGGAFRGKSGILEQVLVALFAKGHVLVEDVPGTGKTVLAKALAKSLDASFSRIQCTPDLMPADVTGCSVYSPKTQKFHFRKGPIHSSIVLVDELNRATPRTQSALLEAMAESQVSVDGRRFPLPEPFFLIATENPVESEGTFPLPEAQKDRFMLCISPGYPDAADEALIIESHRRTGNPVDDIVPVATGAEILACREAIVSVHVDEAVRDYLIAFSAATRNDQRVAVGASPRASIALYKASQSLAAIRGRSYVIPEDLKELFLPVLRKRIVVKPEYLMRGYRSETIITEIASSVPVPAFRER
jgi:MoxR-like ATPase